MKRFRFDALEPGGSGARYAKSSGAREHWRSASGLALFVAPSDEWLRAAGLEGAHALDFEDFVAGDDRGRSSARLPLPDPGFREGLRRRLWRLQVLARRFRELPRH